eukprot:scaffold1564_cov266-Ochromonas_danica.AAC.2
MQVLTANFSLNSEILRSGYLEVLFLSFFPLLCDEIAITIGIGNNSCKMILRATLLLTFIICASIAYKANNGRPLNFTIPLSYDFSHSTEDNYAKVDASFVGKYGEIRSTLDYNYHKMYSEERQLFQDRIVDLLLETKIKDHRNNEITCEITAQRWAVFTAGPMGVGKGYTLRWLHRENIFPIEAFVYVDPDV